MKLWADITNAAGLKLGAGPVWSLTGATITRALDGAGSISIDTPGTEERAVTLIRNERRCIIKAEQDRVTRILGEGILRQRSVRGSASNWTLSANGPDLLDLLKRENTLLARVYSGMTVEDIAQDLAGLAGWTANVEAGIASEIVPVRFDGQTILKALQMLASMKGYHLRHAGGTVVEIGLFGTNNGVRLVNAAYAPPQIHSNPNVMLVSTINISEDSENVFNWILPVGGGEGESAVTLEHSTRTSPYTIHSMVSSGKTIYYLSDATSITNYGTIKKVGRFKQIMPISNSPADIEAAANALYDAAVAALQRAKQSLISYSVTVKNVKQTVNVGDKIRLVYKGLVKNDKGVIVDYCDVDEDLWVMKASERHTGDSLSLSLTLANVDRQEQTVASIVVGALEAIELRDLRVQPYPTQPAYVYRREIDPDHTAIVPIKITNAVMFLNQCRLTVTSRPFRATSRTDSTSDIVSSAGGGTVVGSTTTATNHEHLIMRVNDPSAPGSTAGFVARMFTVTEQSTGLTFYLNALTNAGASSRFISHQPNGSHTHDVTIVIGNHTHTIPAFEIIHGIEDDTEYPDTVGIKINGVDRTSALGGPWGVGGSAINVDLDITQYLLAAPTLQQVHQIEFFCTDGQGEMEVVVEIRETVQSIAVT